MPFQCKYLSACKWDLGSRIDAYNRAVALAAAYGKTGTLREIILVNILRIYAQPPTSHSDDEILHRLERWLARPTTSLDKLDDMMTGAEPLVWSNTPTNNKPPPAHRRIQAPTTNNEDVGSFDKIDEQYKDLVRKMTGRS